MTPSLPTDILVFTGQTATGFDRSSGEVVCSNERCVPAIADTVPETFIENLSAQIPSQETLDALIGKTGEELLNDGWTCEGWTFEGQNLNELVFHLNHGPFAYDVTFDGTEDLPEDFDEANLNPLTVASITCSGIGDATAIEGPEETSGEDEMASEQVD